VAVGNSGKNWFYRWRRNLATAAIGVLLGLVGYHAFFGANGLMVYQQKRRESTDLDRQIRTLQQQNGGMEQEIKALKGDPKTIEREARERLRYARPGEVIYTLPAAPAPAAQQKK
jgi:cell division protein FtsB